MTGLLRKDLGEKIQSVGELRFRRMRGNGPKVTSRVTSDLFHAALRTARNPSIETIYCNSAFIQITSN